MVENDHDVEHDGSSGVPQPPHQEEPPEGGREDQEHDSIDPAVDRLPREMREKEQQAG